MGLDDLIFLYGIIYLDIPKMPWREVKRRKFKKPAAIGIYKRKLLFFAVIFGLVIFAGYIYKNNQISADVSTTPVYTASQDKTVNIVLNNKGKILIDGKDEGNRVNFLENADEVRIQILDQPSSYINELTVNLKLPADVAVQTDHQILAIHGIGSYGSEVKDNSTITYKIYGISQTASVSIVAKMPKGTIEQSLYRQAINYFTYAKFSFWVYLAIILPFITFIAMLVFIRFTFRINKVDMPDKSVSSPPMAIPAALVGVLYHQRVTSREIAATLIDLALRKDIYILDRERGFAFGKGRFDQRLLGYEKALLSKIFKNNLSTTQEAIQQKVQEQIYSKRVSMVSAGIYAIATRLGYFRENPRKVHAKYWLFGSFSMILGLAGFAMSFFIKLLPAFTAFFWVGMMVSALLIIIMSAYIPLRTVLGNDALSNWLAFRRFLADPDPIEYSPTVYQLFEAYLPYAIVLDCEAAWARRFTQHNFMIPDWFVTDKNGLGIDDFCLALFPIISYVGRSLAAMREPGFE